MNKKIKTAFLTLVLIQALHSIEEYIGRLWENYPPAQFLSSLISNNHEKGFIIINVCLFIFGILVWVAAVRNYSFALGPILFLTIMEIINSIGHSIWAIIEKDYVPGLLTAPFLFIIAIYIGLQLIKTNHITGHQPG
jgi:hypothetical protein